MKLTIENPTVASAMHIEDLSADIINSLNTPDLTLPERYATAAKILEAAELAAKELAISAKDFVLDPSNGCQPAAGKGEYFLYKGYYYRVLFKYNVNYAQNDDDGRFWSEKNALAIKCANDASDARKARKGIEPSILRKHPLLPKTLVSSTMMFIGTRSKSVASDDE